jgi:hypothetical protein
VGGHRSAVIAVAASGKEQDSQQTEKRLRHLRQEPLHIQPLLNSKLTPTFGDYPLSFRINDQCDQLIIVTFVLDFHKVYLISDPVLNALNYDRFKELGCPIGSVDVQSAHWNIPQKRLKLPVGFLAP